VNQAYIVDGFAGQSQCIRKLIQAAIEHWELGGYVELVKLNRGDHVGDGIHGYGVRSAVEGR
jgi:hypothetical protein